VARTTSLKRRLGAGLALSLLAVFAVQWLVVALSIRSVAESYVRGRLEHDAESLLVAATFDAAGELRLDPARLDAVFERPFSGRYFRAQSGATVIRSRSLWDEDLALSSAVPGRPAVERARGPQDQRLLQLTQAFVRQGRPLTLTVAEDLTPLDRDLARFNLRYGAVSLAALAGLLVLQGAILFSGLRPLEAIRSELRRLGRGEVAALSEEVPRELRPLVREFNGLLALLGERLRRSRQALGNLAHAIKTPLTLLFDLAAREPVRDQPALHGPITAQIEAIRRLVDRELRRARLAGGARPGEKLDLEGDIPRLVDTLRRLHRDKALAVEVGMPPGGIDFSADREDMLELLGNLLDNAFKWARSRVRVALAGGPGLHLVIDDDGPGVPAEALERLSGRGVRLDEATAGHGLGLAIALDIARSYGGHIAFGRSALGGLRVAVELQELEPVSGSVTAS
jgi:signal transduction histidine kinase